MLKLVQLKFGTYQCHMNNLTIDGVGVICISYAMTRSSPRRTLLGHRPTSSLLGPTTLASIVGVQALTYLATFVGWSLLYSDPGFVPWPSRHVDSAQWYVNGDNWEW